MPFGDRAGLRWMEPSFKRPESWTLKTGNCCTEKESKGPIIRNMLKIIDKIFFFFIIFLICVCGMHPQFDVNGGEWYLSWAIISYVFVLLACLYVS